MQGLKRTLLGLALLITAVQAPAALAAPLTLNLTYTDTDPAALTGSGYVTFDDSLLLTGSGGFVAPLDLDDFSLTVYGSVISGGSTTFGLGDLLRWVLSVDGSGTIAGIQDLNFFMSIPGGTVNQNADGYGINGVEVFLLQLSVRGDPIGVMQLTGITVPEPAPALLLGVGLVALGWLRRRARSA